MNGETIEKRLFDLIRAYNESVLKVAGSVYYHGLRPIRKNATAYKEDIVVAFLTGTNGDVQQGTCLVNVYVPDIHADSGMFYADKQRCAVIASLLEKFPSYATEHDAYIYFRQSEMIYTFAEDSINQHFVSLKMDFKVLNENY